MDINSSIYLFIFGFRVTGNQIKNIRLISIKNSKKLLELRLCEIFRKFMYTFNLWLVDSVNKKNYSFLILKIIKKIILISHFNEPTFFTTS